MGRFEKISEKIMPYKIKSIVSNTFADIMIINCGKYFEVQRINYKHETIFKKEVKKEIVELVLLSTNYMVLAIYEDNKYEIINIDKSEIIYSSSFEKINLKNVQNNNYEFVSPYKSSALIQDINKDIEYSIPPLNINSFSKFDVSKISFFESIEKKRKNNFYIMDKENSIIYISQNVINPICEIKLLNNGNKNQNDINEIIIEDKNFSNYKLISMFPFINNSIIYITQENNEELLYHFNYINPPSILNYTIHDSLFKLYYSLYIIDYIKDILNLTEKLITKTKIFLFDKYIDNNNLTYKIDSSNEAKYQSQLKNDFKNNIFFGELSLRLSNMYKKDLFEEGALNKLDDKIHFNLKNIESIIVGNLKPALNRIEVYLKENFFRNQKLNDDKDSNFINIFSSIEFLLNDLIEISSEYRNFIAWLYSMQNLYINGEKNANQVQNKKNGLDKIYIENDSIVNFVQEEKYNMNSIATYFEEKKENNNGINNNDSNENLNVINFSSNDINNNIFSKKYLSKKNISFKSIINQQNQKKIEKKNQDKNNLNEKYIFPKLDSMKSLIKEEISSNYTLLSNESKNLPQDFLILSGIKEKIKKFYVTCNESNEYIIYFTSKENDKYILYLIAINFNSQCKFAKINFSYKMNIKIIDFKITIKNELLLLVKTPMKTEEFDEEMKDFKFTLISSDLSNYFFYDIKSEKGNGDKLLLNLENYEGLEDIKIDELADIECTDNSFLELTGKGFITLVDNSLNKITIIDLIQDN
jgi:hypothetical protein